MNIPNIDLRMTEAIQHIFENYTPFMRFLSAIGDPTVFILLIIVIAWFFDYKSGVKLGILLSFAGLMQGIFKLLFQQPRPFVVSQMISQKAGHPEMGYGLPSGHASVSATLSTYSIYHFKRLLISIIAIFFSFSIGLSRICLGVHSVFQVIAGWLLGMMIIIGYFSLEQNIRTWFREFGSYKTLFLMFTISLLSIVIPFLFHKDSTSFRTFLWESELSLVIGLFHGFTVGGMLYHTRITHCQIHTRSMKKNVVKLVFFLLTTIVFLPALVLSEHLEQKMIACLIIYTASVLLGVWVLYLAPVMFQKLSLYQE